jgi:hypothetical protein
MKHTKTKSVDARRLAETEMDDDDDVKSFILYSLISLFALKSFLAHTRAQNATPRVVSLLCFRFWARLCSRYACHSFSKAHHTLFGLHKSSV